MAKKALYVLVLAAGEGSRMKSVLPKVLHRVAGRSLLDHVLTAARALRPRSIGVVVGVGWEKVQTALQDRGWKDLHFVVQPQPKGSGHAVQQARSWLRSKRGTLLVVYGDTPLLTPETLKTLVARHIAAGHAATFLAMDIARPDGYGRMVLDPQGFVERIAEHRDATEEERRITLVNSGVVCWDIQSLLKVLPKLRPNNVKKEYYLTDAAALVRQTGENVGVVCTADPSETHGVNTRVDLAEAETLWRRRILEHWMLEGVTITDPASTFVDIDAELAPDVVLGPGVIIRGASRIASGCLIDAYSIVESAVVKSGARIGPFARLRPGTVIEQQAHIGNFVEVKKSHVGKGSKANHLTYIGDARIGRGVNIGAGTITCNYDGVAKHLTQIGDHVFVGSNTNLVAPVHVGRGAMIAAGSTVTEDVPADALALARNRQMIKKGWARQWRRIHQRGQS